MIVVKIWGGLGNQLFQYSFGKYLSEKLGAAVKYDIQTTNSLSSFTQRDVGMSFFNIKMTIATAKELIERKYFQNIHFARIERKLAQAFPRLLKTHIVESNKPKPFGTILFRNHCYYEGYWQSFKYLASIEDTLRQEFTLKQPTSSTIINALKDIQTTASVSIHVRRGDYLNNKYFTTYQMAYYIKAMTYFAIPETKFYIFSDDIDWCRLNFIGSQYVFITGNQHFEDLYLMSRCSHNIICNSTFSWWAAWLNNNPKKIVIAPKHWHKRQQDNYNDLIPENWIKIE
jgi:hypothetical protein